MIGQPPASAPPRPDLAWLRHRTRRAVPGTVPAPEASPPPARPAPPPARPAPASSGLDLSAPADALDLSAPTPPPARPSGLDLSAPAPSAPARPAPSLDLSHPSRPQPDPGSSSLDLSSPAPASPAAGHRSSSLDLSDLSPATPETSSRPAASNPLDLSPATPIDTRRPSSDPLDLSPAAPRPSASLDLSPASRVPASPARPAAPARPPARRAVPRLAPGSRVILTRREPTVTLTRVQSGVGTLTVESISSAAVGDVRIGALYALADGTSGVVQLATGIGTAPPHSRRPVITAAQAAHERLTLDLRQSRSLSRLLVYAFSESGRELDWGGTLRLTTFGGARVEVPLDLGRHAGCVAALSLYAIAGEFVLRAEGELLPGAVREVAQAYGYDRITWADSATPVL